MAVTYTTAAKVSSLLRLIVPTTQARLTFSASTDPTLLEVEALINSAEDQIDEHTHHAWRVKTVTDEYHDLEALYTGMYRAELPVKLNHRSIRTLVSGTDKIEIWNGSLWVDLVLAANGYTEGRGSDYWVDYTHGIIYFCEEKPQWAEHGVRVTYRYGEATVSKAVEEACTKLAAMNIAENDSYVIQLPEGVDKYAISSKIESWKKDIQRILSNLQEIPCAVL